MDEFADEETACRQADADACLDSSLVVAPCDWGEISSAQDRAEKRTP